MIAVNLPLTTFERARWFVVIHCYLERRRAHVSDNGADQETLWCIETVLRLAYRHVADQRFQNDADFEQWLLTLWPMPPTA